MAARPEVLVEGLVFPEGPRWWGGRLWWSDIYGHRVLSLQPGADAPETVAELDRPSGLGFLPDGTPLVVSLRHRLLYRLEHGRPVLHADLTGFPGEFANDMVVDRDGLAYVGCRMYGRPGQPPSADLLVLVRPDGTAEVAATDVIGPNGVVISPDGSTLILAETHAHRITAFDRRPDGSLHHRRAFAVLPEGTLPDGMALDAAGAVWIGGGSGGQFCRVAEGGAVIDRVVVDDRWAVACALGGVDRRTLFLATAALTLVDLKAFMDADPTEDLSAFRAWAQQRSQGRIEAVRVDVPGAGTP